VTQLRISRRGAEDLLVDVNETNALVLRYLPALQPGEPFTETVELALSLMELTGLEVLDAPTAAPQSGRAPTLQEVEERRLAEEPPQPTLKELVQPKRRAKAKGAAG
jgi:hypothetical protein